MKIAEILSLYPDRKWSLAQQSGVICSVSRLPIDKNGNPSVDYMDLLLLKNRHKDFGFDLEVIEPDLNWQMNRFKLDLEGADAELNACKQLVRNMGALGISTLCYNFMAHFNWIRTSVSESGRGGALVSSFDHNMIKNAPLTQYGIVSEEFLWRRIKLFLDEMVPVAEKANVKLAIHPDDPPVSPIRGISRIITSSNALKKVIHLVPSKCNGITLCQGTLAAAGEDVISIIEEFGKENKLFFVHFRDVMGHKSKFVETFHDEGQTNMYKAVSKYLEVGFDGPIRVDHVPTMAGEQNTNPGYGSIGRLFAIGYLKGLIEGAKKNCTEVI